MVLVTYNHAKKGSLSNNLSVNQIFEKLNEKFTSTKRYNYESPIKPMLKKSISQAPKPLINVLTKSLDNILNDFLLLKIPYSLEIMET